MQLLVSQSIYIEVIRKISEANVPTDWGQFKMVAYAEDETQPMPHVAMVAEGIDVNQTITMRIHSECITGDLFHSQRCDCGQQLDQAMKIIHEEKGVLIYLRQEGRGIGIINKLKAYNLQDKGFDTVEANKQLGLEVDNRDYALAITILKDLGIKKINLLTNNPDKIKAIEDSKIELVKRLPLEIEPIEANYKYLKTKKDELGHILDMKSK